MANQWELHYLKGKSNIHSSVTESLGPHYLFSRLLKTLADGSISRKYFKYILFGDSTTCQKYAMMAKMPKKREGS